MPPFHAEHVGSLLRHPDLKNAAKAWRAGTLSDADYYSILDAETKRIVQLQERVGLQAVTDGELARSTWFGFFFERMDGFTVKQAAFQFHDDQGRDFDFLTCYTSGRIRRRGSICSRDFQRLQAHTSRTPKFTMPSPTAFHFFRGDACRDPDVYPDIEEWWRDLLEVYRAEVQELVDCGCRYLQLDEVPLAMLCDPAIRQRAADMGLQPAQLIPRYIELINQVAGYCPADMTVAVHLCRGNFRSRWLASGGYAAIAERLFSELQVDAFFLEYDSERAGDFQPLSYIPRHKTAVLGLICSKTAQLEDVGALKRRIGAASRYLPLEQLGISPQCGFASVAGGNALSETEQLAKLGLVVAVAADVWG